MEELRDEIYHWSLDLINKGFKLQGIFLLLSTWNFAYFRYHMRNFKLNEFKRILEKCDWGYFNGRRFEKEDLRNETTVQKIEDIYSSLSDFEGIKYVGAAKVMHLMNPNFFMMWDKTIINYYKANTSPQGYINFMQMMQRMYTNSEFRGLRTDVTIPRAIDLYNTEIIA